MVTGGGGVIRILSDRDDRRIFLGSKFSISRFFGVGKSWQAFFGLTKTNVSMFHVISFKVFWKFLCLGNLALDFLGVKFCSRDFWGFLWKP